MIELNEDFLAGFILAVILNCFYAFLAGFFRALIKARKKTKEVPLRMPKYLDTPVLQACDKCNGAGEINIGAIRPVKCDVCFGRGQAFGVIREKFTEPAGPCSACDGSGLRSDAGQDLRKPTSCPHCNGSGRA